MSKLEVVGGAPPDVRLWVVYGATGRPLQLFKGPKSEAAAATEKFYPDRGPFAVVEMVDCSQHDVEFVVALAHAEFICVQLAMIQQMRGAVQPVRGALIKH